MSVIDMHDAKTPLDEAIEKFERSAESEVLLARDGEPFAKIVRLPVKGTGRRPLGLAEGRYPDFDYEEDKKLDKEIEALFYASPIFPEENR